MNPRLAAEVLFRTLVGEEPNAIELEWVETVIRSVLPRTEDLTPVVDETTRPITNRNFPPPDNVSIMEVMKSGKLWERS